MSKYRKIVWNEGMLLTPHHFQQWDNYFEDLLNSRVQSAKQYDYGVLDIQVNNEAIANSNFQLTSCRAVLSDGLIVNVPDTEAVVSCAAVGCTNAEMRTNAAAMAVKALFNVIDFLPERT